MIIKLMRSLEDWRNSLAVQRVIDAAEASSGFRADSYDVYDDFIDRFRLDVEYCLNEAGHEVAWQYQQSCGIGCIFQGHGEECEAAFEAAMETCKYHLRSDCVEFGKAEAKIS